MITEDFLENMSAGDISNSHLYIHTKVLKMHVTVLEGGKNKQTNNNSTLDLVNYWFTSSHACRTND